MFFRRVFSRKEHTDDDEDDMQQSKVDTQSLHLSNPTHSSPYRSQRRSSIPGDEKKLSSAIQLTPLWETIIRTKRLPDKMNVSLMFDEFAERLRDPEWQVRQHALKVLIDVLIVMSDRSDQYFQPLICPLVENLGHAAPHLRKGALDALKVYMTETAMPETIILEIISLGMEQKTYFDQFDGRVCVGVMLSLPSLVYTSLGTSKQNYIVRVAIEALTKKMLQVTYQEVALKVLLRIREMVGVREFSEHIAHAAYRDFELLCNVYGLPSTPNLQDPSLDLYMPQSETNRVWNKSTTESNCKVKRTELCWREKADETSADEENNNVCPATSTIISSTAPTTTTTAVSTCNNTSTIVSAPATATAPAVSVTVPATLTVAPTQATIICNGNTAEKKTCGTTTTVIGVTSKKVDNEKVIMETEINIENTAVTMRILEAGSNSSENEVTAENSEDDLSSVSGGGHQSGGVVRIMTDSEIDDANGNMVIDVPLKRVTFGEEVTVKLRTPDSDSVLQSDNDSGDAQKAIQQIIQRQQHDDRTLSSISAIVPNHNTNNTSSSSGSGSNSDRMELHNSPNRSTNSTNFLRVTRPKTASIVITSPPPSDSDSSKLNLQQRHKSASPAKRSRRPSYSSDDLAILSPKAPHKGIEVLHNLQQRSPSASPIRSRRNSFVALEQQNDNHNSNDSAANMENNKNASNLAQSPRSPKVAVPKLAMDHIMVVEEISSPELMRKNSTASGAQIKSWENLGLVDDLCLRNLKCGDWRLRSNAMCTIEEMLKSTENLSLVQPCLESLLRTLLSSEKHPDVIEDKRRILINLISRLPLDNLEDRATQILIGICRQGGAGSNRVAKALMQRLPPTAVVIKLISDDFLKSHSSKFRENALQMVLYALMTFPSTYFDIPTCVKKSAEAATDQKKRVRQAALDVLAVLGQISAPKTILEEVTETLQHEKEAHRLIAAIKARLSRKQLPSVTPEGSVHYALRIPTPPQVASNYYFGADIDWITAGIGSVSPVSSKKRFDPTQLAYNYSSSDSNRSVDFMRRPGKDLNSYNMGSSSELEGPIPQSVRDDKNTHFVMAATIPANQMRYCGPGLQKLALQSQSFPDLTNRIDTKIGPYTSNKMGNGDVINKLAKLPATSRFPSMEANIEARMANANINKINDTNFYNGRRFSSIYTTNGNNTVLVRPNASLPRKLHTSMNRNAYYGYSHGTLDSQSSNDESRPSTHPDEYSQQQQSPPKRFVNVEKYLDESSSDSGSPLKTLHDIRYPMKSPNLDERMLQTEELNRKNAQQCEFENMSVEDDDVNNRSQNYVASIKSATSQSIQSASNNQLADTNVNEQANHADSDDDDVSIGISLGKNSPISHASAATTRSIHDIHSPEFDSHSRSARSVGQSSIDEINTVKLNAAPQPQSSIENGNGNGDSGDTIDTSLEHIQNENNEKLMAEESKDETSDDVPQMVEDSDTVDSAEKTAEIHIETQPEQLLDAAYMSIQKPNEVDENEPHSETDTVSVTSTEGSSDYPTLRSTEQNSISHKPVPKMRTAIPTRRNRVTPAPSKSPATAIHKSQSTEMFPLALRRFDKPREAIVASNTCLNQLDSPTWEVTMNGLTTFVRLIRHHPEIVESHMHAYCVALSRQVKNLRSQVSRSACQASTEFFQTHAKHLETECDDLATQLFNRTADTNKFLRADAFRALAAMCDNLTPTKVIHTILTRGATHQNAIVRTTTANLCSRIVSRLGCDKFYAMNRDYRDKLVVAGANFLMEGSLDTRNHAKAFFKQLSAHPQYNRMLQDVIPSRIYRNIEKALRSIK